MSAALTFPEALSLVMVTSARVAREGWNGKGQWVAVQRPDVNSKMSAPYLYLSNAQGQLVPWVPSQGDLFASDWMVTPVEHHAV